MRCPKCRYISFDNTDRCRNCGYEFALTVDASPVDLPIVRDDDALGPLADFPMSEADGPGGTATPRPGAAPASGAFDLPLFQDGRAEDDRPLVTPPAVPRQPLAVRRSSPAVPRGKTTAADDPGFDLDALESESAPARRFAPTPAADRRPAAHANSRLPDPPAAEAEVSDTTAGLAARLFAGVADAVIIGGLCGAVLYITLQVCGLQFADLPALPLPPLGGFLSLLVGGYFILLTAAGGQTLGKMAAGIRVVPMHDAARVSLGDSAMRTAAYLVSVLPAGLGLIPAIIHADRRALHDRLADTRVVKA